MTVAAGEVAYVGKVAGCTVEPCVYANALDASGNICRINSTAKTITFSGAVVAKAVIDYSNGLFAMAATTPLITVGLSATSKVMVIPPVGGGNMALGVTGLDANTLLARGTPLVDISITNACTFFFNGGAGNDVFTGDAGGWTTAPTGWATGAAIATAVGAATTLALTVSGGAGNDTLAGGAGTNTLLGGAGNDTFLQSATARAETMTGGDGFDTVDYGVRAAPVFVSVGANAGISAVTAAPVAAGTNYVVGDILTLPTGSTSAATVTVATLTGASPNAIATVTLTTGGGGYAANVVAGATTTNSAAGSGATITTTAFAGKDDGAAGEGDAVANDIEIVKGGAGNDVLVATAVTLTDVVLIGNAGNDKLTGGSGNDDLCGGTGDDRFYSNPGDDNIVGGAGNDTADYSASTGVVACLNVLDTAATKPCAAQNGASTGGVANGPQKDVINGALTKVCPRATLNIDVAGVPTVTAVPTTMQGGAMAVDVENLTGNPASANALYCGTLACTLFGGTAIDTLYGGAAGDIIVGLGGADIVKTNGGNDFVDLTNAGGGVNQTVDCGNSQSTLLISPADTLVPTACTLANIP